MLLRERVHRRTKLDVLHLTSVLRRFLAYGGPITVWVALQASQAFMERSILSESLPPAVFGDFISAADVIVRGVGLALMPVVTILHPRVMASAGPRMRVGPPEWRILRSGLWLLLLGGAVAGALLEIGKGVLTDAFPGLAGLDRWTVLLLCSSSVLWVMALVFHKPLEVAQATVTMSAWLLVALVVQVLVLKGAITKVGLMAMPIASLTAALVYIAGCVFTTSRQTRAS
jgi:hypothetical protein